MSVSISSYAFRNEPYQPQTPKTRTQEELQQLNLMEWHLLDQMLQKLLWERANSPMQ